MANYKTFCKRFCKVSTTQPLIVQIDLIFGQLLIVSRIATAIQESGGWEVPPLLPPCPPSTSMAVGQPRHAPLSPLVIVATWPYSQWVATYFLHQGRGRSQNALRRVSLFPPEFPQLAKAALPAWSPPCPFLLQIQRSTWTP